MHYAYIIYSPEHEEYSTGSTSDVAKRLAEHNRNIMRSTKNKGRWELIYKEKFNTKTAALKRERQIKSYKGNRLFKKLIHASPSSSLVQDTRFSFLRLRFKSGWGRHPPSHIPLHIYIKPKP